MGEAVDRKGKAGGRLPYWGEQASIFYNLSR